MVEETNNNEMNENTSTGNHTDTLKCIIAPQSEDNSIITILPTSTLEIPGEFIVFFDLTTYAYKLPYCQPHFKIFVLFTISKLLNNAIIPTELIDETGIN
ncbi:unnamed protein product [Heterobilharzia americana]|nr:unnamed protein product [Heterobilharzia americana]